MSRPVHDLALLRAMCAAFSAGRVPFDEVRQAMAHYRGRQPQITVSRGTRRTVARGSKAASGLSAAAETRDPSPPRGTQIPAARSGDTPRGPALDAGSALDHGVQTVADGSLSPLARVYCGHCRRHTPIVDCLACAAERIWRLEVAERAQYADVDSADESLMAACEGAPWDSCQPVDPLPLDAERELRRLYPTLEDAAFVAGCLGPREDEDECDDDDDGRPAWGDLRRE